MAKGISFMFNVSHHAVSGRVAASLSAADVTDCRKEIFSTCLFNKESIPTIPLGNSKHPRCSNLPSLKLSTKREFWEIQKSVHPSRQKSRSFSVVSCNLRVSFWLQRSTVRQIEHLKP